MSRRKRNKAQDDGDKAEIDLTPMLDVVFIMLIFFIVTASFVRENALNVNVPEENESTQTPPDPNANTILIMVDETNDIFVDARRVDIGSVRSLIAKKNAAAQNMSLVVRAHEDSKTDTYAQIADASISAGVKSIMLVPYQDK